MRPPCEIMVQKVLPAIRVEIARLLMQEYGLQQQDIAKRLGVSKAAISQYVSSKRGADTYFFDNAKEEIKDFAESVASNEDTSKLTEDFCNICKILQTEGWKRRKQSGTSEYVVENCSIYLKR